jgi:hypothetical protein
MRSSYAPSRRHDVSQSGKIIEGNPRPTFSPWGTIQNRTDLGEGVTQVSTASHGGLKVAAKQNKLIPEAFRAADGWYEEDCDWAIPFMFLDGLLNWDGKDLKDDARNTLKNYRWRQYEAHFGEVIDPSTCHAKAEWILHTANKDRYVVVSAIGSGKDHYTGIEVPKGHVLVTAVKGGRGPDGRVHWQRSDEKLFMVTSELYATRGAHSFVVPEDAEEVFPQR